MISRWIGCRGFSCRVVAGAEHYVACCDDKSATPVVQRAFIRRLRFGENSVETGMVRSQMGTELKACKDYRWIVRDPRMLGGALSVRGTRLSVKLILECLANGMTLDDIDEAYDHGFPHEALPEIFRVAAERVAA